MRIEELEERASARRYVYALFQRLTGDKPSSELFEALDCDILRMAYDIVGVSGDAAPTLEALIAELEGAPGKLGQLEEEYDRIFVGPFSLPAPPWESVYRDRKRLLMTATTLSVREYYRACGYEAQCFQHVPDDHLAIELDFLSSLSQEALDACTAGNQEGAEQAFAAATGFLNTHLALWIDDFTAELHKQDDSAFYDAIASALAAFIACDKRAA